MAMRSTGTATVSFGLVSVAVKIYTATEARAGLGLHLGCKCGSRLKQQYVCEAEGKQVSREEQVKLFEVEKGRYLTFAPEEAKALEEAATGAIQIEEFVPASAIDVLHYDKAQFVAPDKGAQKAYHLLAGAMRRANRVAVARYAARGKDHVVVLRPVAGGIVMQTLLRGDEVRSIADLGIADAKVSDAEAQMADLLLASVASDAVDWSKYPDKVRERFEAAVAAKAAGAPAPSVEVAREAPVLDLMAALKASLAAKGKAA